jgi:hypothetical protein
MFGGASFGAALYCQLAQPVRAEILEPRLAAPVFEPIAKAFDRVRPAICRYQIN